MGYTLLKSINNRSYSLSDSKANLSILKSELKEIAKERIAILVRIALMEKDEVLAAQQARLAKKIAMRFRARLTYDTRQLFCKKCKSFIVPGNSSRVRIGRAKTRAIRITCLKCGHTYRKLMAE